MSGDAVLKLFTFIVLSAGVLFGCSTVSPAYVGEVDFCSVSDESIFEYPSDEKALQEVQVCLAEPYGDDPKILFRLGILSTIVESGMFTDADVVKFYEESAGLGFRPAMQKLVGIYSNGFGSVVAKEERANFWRAKLGVDVDRCGHLHLMQIIRGVERISADFDQVWINPDLIAQEETDHGGNYSTVEHSIDHLARCAKSGNSFALYHIAMMRVHDVYFDGESSVGISALEQLASVGDLNALASLSSLFAEGVYVTKDIERSNKYSSDLELWTALLHSEEMISE